MMHLAPWQVRASAQNPLIWTVRVARVLSSEASRGAHPHGGCRDAGWQPG